jgi:hypothetical protein
VVENRRVAGGRVVQRHVLYLGEINSTQELAWRRSIEVMEAGTAQPRTLSLFPGDRCEGLLPDSSIVRLKLSEVRLRRPRQWGACWLALELWRELGLDRFWAVRLDPSRKGIVHAFGGDRVDVIAVQHSPQRWPDRPTVHCLPQSRRGPARRRAARRDPRRAARQARPGRQGAHRQQRLSPLP